MKKILVLCDYGQTRSVAMASVLREHGHFAVAGSYDNWNKLSIESMKNFEFDKIIFMQEGGSHNIGRDEWNDCTHSELREKCIGLLKRLEEKE